MADVLGERKITEPTGPVIYTLVAGMEMAAKFVKAAQEHHLQLRNFDKADLILKQMDVRLPCMIFLDGDHREAEAYKVLRALAFDPDRKRIPVIGYVSQGKRQLKQEMEAAGCLRVYQKTEFLRELGHLIVRYAG